MSLDLNICALKYALQIVSAVFALLAAWKWFVASSTKGIPAKATMDNLDDVYRIIGRQS